MWFFAVFRGWHMRGLSGHLWVQCTSGGGVPATALAFGTLGAQAIPDGSPCVYRPAGSLTPRVPGRRQLSYRLNRFGRRRLKESAWNPQQPMLQPRKVAKNLFPRRIPAARREPGAPPRPVHAWSLRLDDEAHSLTVTNRPTRHEARGANFFWSCRATAAAFLDGRRLIARRWH